MGRVVTIDGPAASGKTSVSRELAHRLGWFWVSTGAFYRGLAYVAQRLKYNLDDEQALAKLAASDLWKVEMAETKTRVYIKVKEDDFEDVTDSISHEDIGNIASKISHFPKVRQALLEGQRDCRARTEGLVAEGRDCGTVVFPDAEVKIYLTARSENRAERRAKELGLNAEATAQAQSVRDHQDSTRKVAPMQIPEHALLLDSTEMSLDQVVSKVEAHVKQTLHR
jgi:cytidylate kinase